MGRAHEWVWREQGPWKPGWLIRKPKYLILFPCTAHGLVSFWGQAHNAGLNFGAKNISNHCDFTYHFNSPLWVNACSSLAGAVDNYIMIIIILWMHLHNLIIWSFLLPWVHIIIHENSCSALKNPNNNAH